MKLNYSVFIVLLVFVFILVANCNLNSSKTIREDNVVKKEERVLGKFTAIDLAMSAEVKIYQGDPQKILVEGSISDLKKVIIETKDSRLIIRSQPGTWQIGKIYVFITMGRLTDIYINGSGNVFYSANQVVETHISGSGKVIKM
jgi:hypothetical protein